MSDQAMESCKNVNENPCHMCMPMGGILALKGIERSMVILHGSQGCSTYMRRHIAAHFNEPVDVGSSSLNEKGTIYGGEKNLVKAIDNILKVYQPDLIGVLTTCLAETIGEDIDRIVTEYLREKNQETFPIITAPTPGYGSSQAEGYYFTVKRTIMGLAEATKKHNRVNIITAHMSPADLRELKRILALMDIDYIMCPDYSETLDAPYVSSFSKMPQGGTKLADIKAMGGAIATIQLGVTVDEKLSPGKYLEETFGVPLYTLPIPMGIENTDQFIHRLSEITGKTIPVLLEKERGRLIDAMIDSHKYNMQGRSVVYGEPELVYGVTKVCLENGIEPVVVATGSKPGLLTKLLGKKINVMHESDFVAIRAKSREQKANIAIGHSDGHYLTEKDGIPLVRIGFPIHDRIGGQRILSVGYAGTMLLLDRLTNTLLEHKYHSYRSRMYEQYYDTRANKA
ncbi:MAG: nitrogenase component 1 [Sporomusaceae bacterium]|nr:nitrogenase component 1 [Sporomusaceae bacterium]